jgi:uncharacterized membrane protein
LKPVIHRSHSIYVYVLFALIFFIAFIFILTYSLRTLGFAPLQIVLFTFVSLLGASVNIPVATLRSREPILMLQRYRIFGMELYVPFISYEQVTVAVNVGGALVPVAASAYLILAHLSYWPSFLVATLFSSLLIHAIARPVKGVGIVTPFFIPPIIAAFFGMLFGGRMAPVVAYVAGSMGSLIGADLMNINKLDRLGASFVSIGGAGVFDGVFLTGLVAALLTL